MKIKHCLLLVCCFFFINSSYSQTEKDSTKKDNSFYDLSAGFGITRINTNYTVFGNSTNNYLFKKNNYMFSSSAHYILGNYLKHGTFVKYGVIMNFKSALLTDNNNNELRFNESYVSIPIMWGILLNNYKHSSLEVSFGVSAGTPMQNRLDYKDNLDSKYQGGCFGRIIKYNAIMDIGYWIYKDKKYKVKFGLMQTSDFANFTKIKDTKYAIYPRYISYEFYVTLLHLE